MNELRVLIADDEMLARKRLHRLLAAMDDVALAGEAANGEQVLAAVRAGTVDVVLLDIQMPGLTGLEAMQLWPENGPYVVFCTAHTEHALKAFDVGAIDYLLKPVEPARLAKALARARARDAQRRFHDELHRQRQGAATLQRLAISTRQGVVLLDPLQVSHATLEDELVTVVSREGTYITADSLHELLEKLPKDRFERVHRRAVLNLEQVVRLEPQDTGGYVARTRTGHAVDVSRQAARELRKRLGLRKAPGDDEP